VRNTSAYTDSHSYRYCYGYSHSYYDAYGGTTASSACK
jgi:hypothetical protein